MDLEKLAQIVSSFDQRLFNVERNLALMREFPDIKKQIADSLGLIKQNGDIVQTLSKKLETVKTSISNNQANIDENVRKSHISSQIFSGEIEPIKKVLSEVQLALKNHSILHASSQSAISKLEQKMPLDAAKNADLNSTKVSLISNIQAIENKINSVRSDVSSFSKMLENLTSSSVASSSDIVKLSKDIKATFDSFNAFTVSVKSVFQDLKNEMSTISSSVDAKIKEAIPVVADITTPLTQLKKDIEGKITALSLDVSSASLKAGNSETLIKMHTKQLENAFLQLQKIQLQGQK